LWDEEQNHHLFTRANLRKAQILIDMIATHDLRMALPQGIPTLQAMAMKNFTRMDNIFLSDSLMNRCARCTTLTNRRPPKTDHIPVVWDLDLDLEHNKPTTRLDWKDTDWDEFREKLRDQLSEGEQDKGIRDKKAFDDAL
jgi:hypothetical protein